MVKLHAKSITIIVYNRSIGFLIRNIFKINVSYSTQFAT